MRALTSRLISLRVMVSLLRLMVGRDGRLCGVMGFWEKPCFSAHFRSFLFVSQSWWALVLVGKKPVFPFISAHFLAFAFEWTDPYV